MSDQHRDGSVASSLPTEPSVVSARLRASGNAVERAIASADDRSSIMIRQVAKVGANKNRATLARGSVTTNTAATPTSEGLVLDGQGHVLGVRNTQGPSAGGRQRRQTGRAVLSLPRASAIIGSDDSSDSDEGSMPPPPARPSRAPSSSSQRMDFSVPNSPVIYINGVECDTSSDRIIPDVLFGPHVLLMDNTTRRLLLPNGIDGSVRVVAGRDYSTVKLRGGTADLVFAGVLEDDRRLVPRSWIFETVSAAYRAGSAQFYDSVPTLAEHINEARQIDPALSTEAAIASHPAAVCEEHFRSFHRALGAYRKSAAEQVPVRGAAATASSQLIPGLLAQDVEAQWASAANGKNRKQVTAFGVFIRENAGINMVACAAAFATLTPDEKQRYVDLAAEFNLRAEEGQRQAIVMSQMGTQLMPAATQVTSSQPLAVAKVSQREVPSYDDDDAVVAAPKRVAPSQASIGSFDDPHQGPAGKAGLVKPPRSRRDRSDSEPSAPRQRGRKQPAAAAITGVAAAAPPPAPRSAFAALAAASSQLSQQSAGTMGGIYSQLSSGGFDDGLFF